MVRLENSVSLLLFLPDGGLLGVGGADQLSFRLACLKLACIVVVVVTGVFRICRQYLQIARHLGLHGVSTRYYKFSRLQYVIRILFKFLGVLLEELWDSIVATYESLSCRKISWTEVDDNMMEIRLKSTYLELLFVCLCLLTVLGPANGETVVKVREGSEAFLPCFIRPERNITGEYFNWRKVVQKDNKEVFEYDAGEHYYNGVTGQDEQFKGRVSHFPDQLQFSNASIVIRDTKLSDSGTYTCDFALLQPKGQMFTIDLVVVCILKDRSGENIPGSSLRPNVTSHERTGDKAHLQCEVRGVSPKPKVKWQDSSGNILHAEEPQVTERGGSYDIILKTTVTETGNYHCVVTQEDICHQVSGVAFVYISVSGSSTGWSNAAFSGGGGVGVVVVVLLLLLVFYIKRHKIRHFFKGPQTETERNQNGDPNASDKQGLPQSVVTDGDGDEQREPTELDELNKSPSSSCNKNSVATRTETEGDEEEKL